jgi:hypothetical protein
MSDDKEQVKGMVVRGADGALYFVPDDKLESFRIPEENVPRLDGIVKKGGKHILKGGPEHITISADEAAVADVHMLPPEKQSQTGS